MARSAGSRIRAAQLQWAQSCHLVLDKDGYCPDLDANLFQPLTACSRRDLESADGAELGKNGSRGKLQAVHSSAALVCNTFDYWRGRDLALIGQALGLPERSCSLRLEGKFATGLRGTPPNLDVVFEGVEGTTSAIESKFAEPYAKAKSKNRFKDKYFPTDARLWAQRGLHAAQEMAEALHAGRRSFDYLDAAQLLRHCLGLSRSAIRWTLTYLWFDAGGEEGAAHGQEARSFIDALKPDHISILALSYQDLFSRLAPTLPDSDAEYRRYLELRYFSHAGR